MAEVASSAAVGPPPSTPNGPGMYQKPWYQGENVMALSISEQTTPRPAAARREPVGLSEPEEEPYVPIVHFLPKAEIPDRDRRLALFSGDLFVYEAQPNTLSFCHAARNDLEKTLGPEPMLAQQRMSETEFPILFKAAARNFSQIVTELAAGIVSDFGCDPSTTFIGESCLAATTGHGFMAHGMGVPQHPHRDTWYAASPCQLNWWIPLYDLDASSSFAFHPQYWDSPIENSSADFDYGQWPGPLWNDDSFPAVPVLSQPRPLVPIDLTPDIRISCPAGNVILSSVAQLYSAVPNETLKTHFSVHFQTVNKSDLESGAGVVNIDAEPRGTSLSSFVRCDDLSPISPRLIELELERRKSDAVRQTSYRGTPA